MGDYGPKPTDGRAKISPMLRLPLLCLLVACADAFTITATRAAVSTSLRSVQPRLNFLDGIVKGLQDSFKEATVQHVLVGSQMEALAIYDAIEAEEGPRSKIIGRYARQKSTCGSAKKSPDAKLGLLKGLPGELKFRKGEMAKEFEQVAFEAPIGAVNKPVETKFGWHIVLVNERSGE